MNLYKFYVDCRRNGSLEGLLVATKEDIKNIVGKEVYFGDVLGKHSDISVVIKKSDFKFITSDSNIINKLKELNCLIGHNPFNYLEEDEEYEEEEDEEDYE